MTLAFSHVRFVMVQPSHPGNVGSAARAIKTMGFSQLVLVEPRYPDMLTCDEAVALASGATDILDQAQVFNRLEDALAPVTMAFALTARPRDLGPPAGDIRQSAGVAREHLEQYPEGQVAVLLGTERAGLTNAQIGLCHRICHIPANPEYSSLNVAQALQLAAWELRYALMPAETEPERQAPAATARERGAEPASGEATEAFLVHWQQALTEIGFLDPAHPKKLIPRMRHMFGRNALTKDEETCCVAYAPQFFPADA